MSKITASKIKFTTLLPTSLIINGLDRFGYELAKSLSEQGGYVIIIDNLDKEIELTEFYELKNVSFLDFVGLTNMIDEIRRLDYVFFLNHNSLIPQGELSSQEFLSASTYLNEILNLAVEFEALFLLTNSIKTHKVLLTSNTFGAKQINAAATNYLAYSQAEFVRYSEGLVLEFKQAKNLEAKILRLGEMLGEGVELAKDTNIGKLILEAIGHKYLFLDEDGLSSEYYIHILDAIYGVIKAQFSRNLKNDIYSLAYPDAITQLSLAYKLQEIEPEAGEIRFVNEADSKVRLDVSIYRAAPNLSEIGWQPKIDFTTALMQSLSYAKQLLQKYQEEPTSIIESNVYESGELIIPNGALARLIAEKKQNDLSAKKKLNQTANDLELKSRNLTLGKRLRKSLIKYLDKFKQNFIFLRNLTLQEAALYLGLITVLGIFFFLILVPIISVIKDFAILDYDMQNLNQAEQNNNWVSFTSLAQDAQTRTNSINNVLQNSNNLFVLAGQSKLQQELLASDQSVSFLSQSLTNFGQSLIRAEDLNKNNPTDLAYRPTNASILSVNTNTINNSSSINSTDLTTNNELASTYLSNAQKIYSQLDNSVLPIFLQSYLKNIFSNQQAYSQLLSGSHGIFSVLNSTNQSDYILGIAIEDSQRPNFAGGEISALGILEFSQGKIISAQLLPIQSLNLTLPQLSDDQASEIQKLSVGQISPTNNTAQVFNYIFSKDKYNTLLKKTISATFKRDAANVLILNSSGFQTLLNNYGDITVNDQQISASNYLAQINLLQKQSVNSRNLVLANISSVLLIKFFNTHTESLIQKGKLIARLFQENSLSTDNDLQTQLGLPNEMPEISLAITKANVQDFTVDSSLNYSSSTSLINQIATSNISVDVTNVNQIANLLVCSSKAIKTFSLPSVPIEDYNLVTLDNYNCILFNASRVKQFGFVYTKQIPNNSYSYSLAISQGVRLRYDVEVIYPIGSSITGADPEPNRKNNSVYYPGETVNEFKLNLNFK